MTSDSPAPYRVLIGDRLAFVADDDNLDAVLEDLARRLSSVGGTVADADLAIWRLDRLEAIVLNRPGRAFEVTRLSGGLPPRPARRPRTTIGALMLVVLACALVLVALRSPAGVDLLKSSVMLGLMAAVAGSAVATLYYTLAFFRDDRP